ncbi:MAG: putative toxin-antitoxin system toxin component, PIN family [Gemmatimonadota bacterium]
MKVFLDTNVLVSAFAARGLCADVLRVVLAEHEMVIGSTVLAELTRVLQKKLGLPPATVQRAEAFLGREAVLVELAPPVSVEIRAEGDAPILAEAVAGGAEVLVTGGRDLLDIADDALLPILSPRAFWERLRSAPHDRH